MLPHRYGADSRDLEDTGTESLSPSSVPEGPRAANPRPRNLEPIDIERVETESDTVIDARRLLETLNVGVLVFDHGQNLRYGNREHARLLGRDLAQGGSMEDWLRAACRDADYAERVIRSWREHVWQKQLTRVFSLKNASDQLR